MVVLATGNHSPPPHPHISTGQCCSDLRGDNYIYICAAHAAASRDYFRVRPLAVHIYILYVRQLAAALLQSD